MEFQTFISKPCMSRKRKRQEINEEERAKCVKKTYDTDDSQEDDIDVSQEYGSIFKCSNKDTSDIVCGTDENQVAEEAEEDLHKHFVNCKKNPGHKQFVPVNDFNINHLPEGYHDNELVEYIKATADLTVMVSVKMTSTERPELWPNNKEPYPFYNIRGSEVMRVGTGMVRFGNIEFNKGTCPCLKCRHSDTPSKVWGEVCMYTATHVVFDDLEARHTTCRLFYDRQDSPLVTLDGWVVFEADIEEDWCELKCVTCDEDLLHKLKNMVRRWVDLRQKIIDKYKSSQDKLTLIISHPHGCPKHIYLGHWIDKPALGDIIIAKERSQLAGPRDVTALVKDIEVTIQETWKTIRNMFDNKLTIQVKSYPVTLIGHFELLKSLGVRYPQIEIMNDGTQNLLTKFDGSGKEFLMMILLFDLEMEEMLAYLKNKMKDSENSLVTQLDKMLQTISFVAKHVTLITEKSLIGNENLLKKIESMKIFNMFMQRHPMLTFNIKINLTEADVFCKLIGLNHELSELFWSLQERDCSHQSVFYYIERWIEDAEEDIKNDVFELEAAVGGLEIESDKEEQFVSLAQSLGLTKETAEQLLETIPSKIIDQQKASYWIMKYLTNIISYHPVFTEIHRFIYSEGTKGEWFDEEIKLDQSNHNRESATFIIKMINIESTPESKSTIEDYLKKIESAGKTILYHGTDHKSAKSIIEKGILLNKGKPCQDFSSNDGFYLSYSYDDAKMWSSAGRKHFHAVLVFEIDDSLLEIDGDKRRDLTDDQNTWKDVVTFCRKGCENPRKRRDLLGGIEFIRGPMCRNGKEVSEGKPPKGFGRDDTIQICIRDDSFAKTIGHVDNIACVIFL